MSQVKVRRKVTHPQRETRKSISPVSALIRHWTSTLENGSYYFSPDAEAPTDGGWPALFRRFAVSGGPFFPIFGQGGAFGPLRAATGVVACRDVNFSSLSYGGGAEDQHIWLSPG